MELLGPSLENLFQNQKKQFSIKTACMLGIQMVDRIEYLHSRKIIHRDIKPDNFVIGKGLKSHIVYVLDFGLSKKYWSSTHKCHIPPCKNKKLTGTARYASINALSGFEQSRRDDLESIGYIIMYFIRGSLPWQGLKINNKEDRYKKICEKKKSTSSKELCNGFPNQLESFVSYTRNLQFTEVPDYEYLRNLLKTVITNENSTVDFYYDWCNEKPNIKSDDIIYTNNYGIVYNGKNDWLNNNNQEEKISEEGDKKISSFNNADYIYNKRVVNNQNIKSLSNTNHNHIHNKIESNNSINNKNDELNHKNYNFTNNFKK